MSRRRELITPTVCRFCFADLHAHTFAYEQEDCTFECAKCHAEAERVKRVRELGKDQQDLFGS